MTPTRPTVVFAMRYPDDVGLVWASQANVYAVTAAELASEAAPLLCFPVLTEKPAFDTPWTKRLACDWYDTHTPASREAIAAAALEHHVRVVVYMGCPGESVDWKLFRRLGIRTLNYEVDSYPTDATQPWYKWAVKKVLRGLLHRGVHCRYAANSIQQRDFLLRFAALPASRLDTVVNGVDVERFSPGSPPDPAALGLPATDNYIVSVSQARAEKRVDVLIDAARAILDERPGASLTFVHVGGGPCLEEWKARAAALGLGDRFQFAGSKADVLPYHRLATVFVHAAERESFGFAVVEAMACGKPVVAAKSPGPCEVIVQGETGLLVGQKDPSAFARAIPALLDDRSRRERMGAAGRERAVRLYDIRRQSRELADVIRKLL
jgi:glycosyltransferase involved in cell wall biosynthesis